MIQTQRYHGLTVEFLCSKWLPLVTFQRTLRIFVLLNSSTHRYNSARYLVFSRKDPISLTYVRSDYMFVVTTSHLFRCFNVEVERRTSLT